MNIDINDEDATASDYAEEENQNSSMESDDTIDAYEFLREQARVTDAALQLYAELLLDDSDDESDNEDTATWGGSRPG